MEIYYDSEFIDTGTQILPLSIGMVREDGAEYYAINNNYNFIQQAAKHQWLRENVLDSFPLVQPLDIEAPQWDESHPDFECVTPIGRIRWEVANFIMVDKKPSLWAWFAAYDHVLLAQLFGTMMQLPPGIPMRTNDVAQEAERLRVRVVPKMPGTHQHNALHDAREVKFRREWLKNYEKQ